MRLNFRIIQYPWLSILCLLFHISASAVEKTGEFLKYAEDHPALFTPDPLATLINGSDQFIGGVVSPLSGNLCFQQTDSTIVGAQSIRLNRTYIETYMPNVFHKHLDRDHSYRRTYLRKNYVGWKFFPHTQLWFDAKKQEGQFILPSGAMYNFTLSNGKTSLVFPYAINNIGKEEIPSGKYDPRNTRFSQADSCITVFSSDGFRRYYKLKERHLYLLDKEKLPNGKVYKYHYTGSGELSRIESLDPEERHTYASLQIKGIPGNGQCRITSSTGLDATYIFENRNVEGSFHSNQAPKRISYSYRMPPLLVKVSSPQYRNEKITHTNVSLLIDSFSGKNKFFSLSKKPFGKGDKSHLRVDKLLYPVGPNDELIPVYEMTYDLPIAGEKEGKTTVYNQNGTSTVYHFSRNLLTTCIQYFGEDKSLKKEKVFSWDDNNWLSSVELRGGDKNLLFRKSYKYDKFGNPTFETFFGDLQGRGDEESYSIKREFSQDGQNLLLSEETEDGKITTFEYLPETNLVTEKCIKGEGYVLIRESYQYDKCHNLIRKTIGDDTSYEKITVYSLRQQAPFLHMPEYIEEKYKEEGREKLLKLTYLTYDQWGNIIEEKVHDANGTYAYSILKEYDEQGNLLSETNRLGQRHTFTYDDKGRCLEETNFSQNIRKEMCYDLKGRLRKYKDTGKDGSVHTAAYEYDLNDNLTQKIDTYGNSFSYTYDPLTQKVIRTDSPSIMTSDGLVNMVSTSSTYDPLGREISKTDANGNTTIYRYNAYGSLTEINYPNESKELYRYTKSGKLASHTDQEGLTIRYRYDVLGRVISKQYGNALGEETFIYDSFHLLKEIDLDGNTTCYHHDAAGRKVQKEKCGRLIGYTYDSLGRLSTISQGDLRTHFKRDLEGRVIEKYKTNTKGELLYKICYCYNGDGDLSRITRYVDGKEAVEMYRYDSFRRQLEAQDPYGSKTTTAYDENHVNNLGQRVLQVTTTDPHGIAIIETKDPFLRVIKERKLNSQGVTIAFWEKFYDPNGNVTDWNEHVYIDGRFQNTQKTHFTHTSNNNIESLTRAFKTSDSRTTHYTYTPSGKVSTKALPDGTMLSYTYGPLGFISLLTSSDGIIKHHFEHNKNGKLIFACDDVEDIQVLREVDPFGNVEKETFSNGISIEKTYDTFDRTTTLKTPAGSVTYHYGPLFLRSVTRFDEKLKPRYRHDYESYDLSGHLLSEKMIEGAGKVKYNYDLKGRRLEVDSPYFSQKCLYDECDNLLQSTIDHKTIPYTYDDLSQLTSENESIYGYDSLYNRIKKDDDHFQMNPLNESVSQDYDLNGNRIQKGDNRYIYDPLNRLKEVVFGSRKICFLYDPLGRCLTKITLKRKSNTWQEIDRENYLYDGQYDIGTLMPGGTLKHFRVLGRRAHANLPITIAIELGKKAFVPLMDTHGNICRLVDAPSKKLVSSYEFRAFGEEKTTVVDPNPWRYASKRFHSEINLIDFGKRYYDPEEGRWLTKDPAGFIDSLNLYQYALNNPFRYSDPTGEFIFSAVIPFALVFTPAVVKICIDAVALGIGSSVVYQGVKHAAANLGSPYTVSERTCYGLLGQTFNRYDYDFERELFSTVWKKAPPYDGKELGNDPTKKPGEGFEWRGKGKQGSKEGSWYNPETGEQLYPDLSHPAPIKPHWDYYGPNFPNGARLNIDGTWSSK
ncbi:MAG: hypothetical protein S4CHLAM45_05260 [Chlamydiales bacterium]|nr:hypothetical protein [Chlamydiales bacterium]MCH9619933.1 hypothetical protein [Chlamydiales bacterium]MCH9622640.1 hypothetical protein [Chlamydiales bacterium]